MFWRYEATFPTAVGCTFQKSIFSNHPSRYRKTISCSRVLFPLRYLLSFQSWNAGHHAGNCAVFWYSLFVKVWEVLRRFRFLLCSPLHCSGFFDLLCSLYACWVLTAITAKIHIQFLVYLYCIAVHALHCSHKSKIYIYIFYSVWHFFICSSDHQLNASFKTFFIICLDKTLERSENTIFHDNALRHMDDRYVPMFSDVLILVAVLVFS